MNDAGQGQIKEWGGRFGRDYTDRNPHNAAEMDALHVRNFGLSRTALNQEFLDTLDRGLRILEVGCNIGAQLDVLRTMGFHQLYGIELLFYALQQGRALRPDLPTAQASAFEIPFPDASFDLVFTSGVLIHISPENIGRAMGEVCRCARRYVWGWEYFCDRHVEITYRGQGGLLWKGDFAAMYLDQCPGLKPVKEKRLKYLADNNVDSMFLLEKA